MGTEDYGKVEFEGRVITLKQQPYLSGLHGARYEASGVDQDGNDVSVKWEIKSHWLNENGEMNGEMEDEGDACDWDAPVEVYVY